jgi:hypothetical protein
VLLAHRREDVGKPKAEVAAKRVMQRVLGCQVEAHVGRIEDKPDEFYEQFSAIVLGLDSLEARRYMNGVVCSFLGGPPLPSSTAQTFCCPSFPHAACIISLSNAYYVLGHQLPPGKA